MGNVRSPAARAAVAVALVVLAVLAWWLAGRGSTGSQATAGATVAAAPSVRQAPATSASTSGSAASGAQAPVRAKALRVLAVVDATGAAPKGYVGGRQFMNDSRGGTSPLPRRDAAGRSITYHEYDVNPYQAGVNRGPERLVVGSDGSAFCTGDHYVTWTRLR